MEAHCGLCHPPEESQCNNNRVVQLSSTSLQSGVVFEDIPLRPAGQSGIMADQKQVNAILTYFLHYALISNRCTWICAPQFGWCKSMWSQGMWQGWIGAKNIGGAIFTYLLPSSLNPLPGTHSLCSNPPLKQRTSRRKGTSSEFLVKDS